ncbi:MAG: MFS transporter [Steroidobacteraceae bacterium]
MLLLLASLLAMSGAANIFWGLVLQDIKTAFAMSDTQLGLLTGLAFALFYSLMSLPLARLADRGNRVALIAGTTALWSGAVALVAFATTFRQLMWVRVGMAVGEAGCIPLALPLIAEHFSREERPRAIALYMQGGAASIVIGYFFAGWLTQWYSWRTVFLLLGVPGLLLAPLAGLTLRQPSVAPASARSTGLRVTLHDETDGPTPSLSEVGTLLSRNRTFRRILVYYIASAFFTQAIAQWQPTLFLRRFSVETGELGTWMAVISGIGVMTGTYLMGEWASRYAPNNERLQFKVMALAFAGAGLFMALTALAPNRYWAFAWLALCSVASATGAPLFAALQTLLPDRARSTATTVVFLCSNLVGASLGPLAAGALSDLYERWAHGDALRYALFTLCPGYLVGGWALWRASRTVTHDLTIAQRPTLMGTRAP